MTAIDTLPTAKFPVNCHSNLCLNRPLRTRTVGGVGGNG
jgi:hypothetical protein